MTFLNGFFIIFPVVLVVSYYLLGQCVRAINPLVMNMQKIMTTNPPSSEDVEEQIDRLVPGWKRLVIFEIVWWFVACGYWLAFSELYEGSPVMRQLGGPAILLICFAIKLATLTYRSTWQPQVEDHTM